MTEKLEIDGIANLIWEARYRIVDLAWETRYRISDLIWEARHIDRKSLIRR